MLGDVIDVDAAEPFAGQNPLAIANATNVQAIKIAELSDIRASNTVSGKSDRDALGAHELIVEIAELCSHPRPLALVMSTLLNALQIRNAHASHATAPCEEAALLGSRMPQSFGGASSPFVARAARMMR
jgi:hypothetical protein